MAEYIIQDSTVDSIGKALKDRSKFIPSATFSHVPTLLEKNFNRPEEHYKCYGVAGRKETGNSISDDFYISSFEESGSTLFGESQIYLTLYPDSTELPPDGWYEFYPSYTVTAEYSMSVQFYDPAHYDDFASDTHNYTILQAGNCYDVQVANGSISLRTDAWVTPYLGNYTDGCVVNRYSCSLSPDIGYVQGYLRTSNAPSYFIQFLADEIDLSTPPIIRTINESGEDFPPIVYSAVEVDNCGNYITFTTNESYSSGWFYINYEYPKRFNYVHFRIVYDTYDIGSFCTAKVALEKNSTTPVICYPSTYGALGQQHLTATVYPISYVGAPLVVHLEGHYEDMDSGEIMYLDNDFECHWKGPASYICQIVDADADYYALPNSYMSYSEEYSD